MQAGTPDPARMAQTYSESAREKAPDWYRAATMTSPRAKNAMDEGTMKNAMRSSPPSRRVARSLNTEGLLGAASQLDSAGSLDADIAMPNRLTGIMLNEAAAVMAAMTPAPR